MKRDPDEFDESIPWGTWAARALLLGTAAYAGYGLYKDIRANETRFWNPFITPQGSLLTESVFGREKYLNRLQKFFTLGQIDVANKLTTLSQENRDILVRAAQKRFGYKEDFLKGWQATLEPGGISAKEIAWWEKQLGVEEMLPFMRRETTTLAKAQKKVGLAKPLMDISPLPKLPRAAIRRETYMLRGDAKQRMINLLKQHFFQTNEKEALLTADALENLAETLGAGQAKFTFEKTAAGQEIATGIEFFQFPNVRGTKKSLHVPIVHQNGMAFRAGNWYTVRQGIREDWFTDILTAGTYIPQEEYLVPGHRAILESMNIRAREALQRGLPVFSSAKSALQEETRLFLYEMADNPFGARPTELPFGLRSQMRGMQLIGLGQKRNLSVEEMRRIQAYASAAGHEITPYKSAMAKGIWMSEKWRPGRMTPAGISSADIFPILRDYMLAERPGQPAGAISGRWFKRSNMYVRNVPYVTTPTRELAAASLGAEQLLAMRTIAPEDISKELAVRKFGLPASERVWVPWGEAEESLLAPGERGTFYKQYKPFEVTDVLSERIKSVIESGKLTKPVTFGRGEIIGQSATGSTIVAKRRTTITGISPSLKGQGFTLHSTLTESTATPGTKFFTYGGVGGNKTVGYTVPSISWFGKKGNYQRFAFAAASYQEAKELIYAQGPEVVKAFESMTNPEQMNLISQLADPAIGRVLARKSTKGVRFPKFKTPLINHNIFAGLPKKGIMGLTLTRASNIWKDVRGLRMLSGNPLSTVTGKGYTPLMEGLLSELVHRGGRPRMWETLASIGVTPYSETEMTALLGRAALPGETHPLYISRMAEMMEAGEFVGKTHPWKVISGLSRGAGIISSAEHLGLMGIMKEDPAILASAARSLGVSVTGELESDIDIINKALARSFRRLPLSQITVPGDIPMARGAGKRGTISERGIRELGIVAPSSVIEHLSKRQIAEKAETLTSLTQQMRPFLGMEPPKGPGFKDISLAELAQSNLLGAETPGQRTEALKRLGLTGKEHIVTRFKPLSYGTKSLDYLVIPSSLYGLIGTYPIEGKIGPAFIQKPLQGAIREITETAIMQEMSQGILPEAADDAILNYLRLLEEYGAETASKVRTGAVRGSIFLQPTNPRGVAEFVAAKNAQAEALTQRYYMKSDLLKMAKDVGLEAEMAEIAKEAEKRRLPLSEFMGGGLGFIEGREPMTSYARWQFGRAGAVEDLFLNQLLAEKGLTREKIGAAQYAMLQEEAAAMAAKRIGPGRYAVIETPERLYTGQAATMLDYDADMTTNILMIDRSKLGNKFGSRVADVDFFNAVTGYERLQKELTPRVREIINRDISDAARLAEIDKLISSEGMGTEKWARMQYRMVAMAEAFRPYLKGVKGGAGLSAYERIIDPSGNVIWSEAARTRLGVEQAAGILEKREIGELSNALQLFHKWTASRAGTLTEQQIVGALNLADLFEESALKAKGRKSTAEQITAVEEMIDLLKAPGTKETGVEFQAKKFRDLLMRTVFAGRTEEQIGESTLGAIPLMFRATSEMLTTAEGKAYLAGKRPSGMESFYRFMLGQEYAGGTQEIIRTMAGEKESFYSRASRILGDIGEMGSGVARSLGRRKGLLLAGVGTAIGVGLLVGGTGHIKEQDAAAEAREVEAGSKHPSLPSTPYVNTARISPGLRPTIAVNANANQLDDWSAAGATTMGLYQPKANPVVITNVNDYRRNLDPDYILNRLKDGY